MHNQMMSAGEILWLETERHCNVTPFIYILLHDSPSLSCDNGHACDHACAYACAHVRDPFHDIVHDPVHAHALGHDHNQAGIPVHMVQMDRGAVEGSMVVGQFLEDSEGIHLASVVKGLGSQGGTGFLNIRRINT